MYKYNDEVQQLLEKLQSSFSITESTYNFYKRHVNRFFSDYMAEDINVDKPLDAISYYDLNTFLTTIECSAAEKVNYFRSFKRFFELTYRLGKTKDVTSQMEKPHYTPRLPKYLTDDEYHKLRAYVFDKNNNIKDRLVLGLFLFTGLSRQYIAALINVQFVYDQGVYKLQMWKKDQEIILPIKSELQIIVHEYLGTIIGEDILSKVVTYADDNYLSTYISNTD